MAMPLLIQGIDTLVRSHYFLSYLLGCVLTLAFAPFGVLPAIIFSFSGLLMLIERHKSSTKCFWLGWWFGFGHFMSGLYWFSHALLTNPIKFGWMVPFALTLIPAALAFFTAIVTFTVSHFHSNRTIRMLAFVSMWVIIEMLRTNFIIPFPWNLLGYAITASDNILQIVSLVGIYGASLLLAFIGSFLFTRDLKVVISTLLIGCFVWGYSSYRLLDNKNEKYEDFKIRIIQPSIVDHPMGSRDKQDRAFVKLVKLSFMKRDQKIKLIVWPEAAFPYGFTQDSADLLHLGKIAPNKGALIFGTDRASRDLENNKVEFFNSIVAVSRSGEVLASYDKETLVPFGEYIPFKNLLPFIQKVTHGLEDFSKGRNKSNLIKIDKLPAFTPLICYEVIFPNLKVDKDTEWFLNITNDAWFGNSIGPYQHFAMAKLRAVEYGIPIIRVANNGISAVISPYGTSIQSLALNDTGVMDINLPKKITVPNSTFKRIFDILPYLIFLIAIAFEKYHRKYKIS